MIEALRLTDLDNSGSKAHTAASPGGTRKRIIHNLQVGWRVSRDVLAAFPRDLLRAVQPKSTGIIRMEDGTCPAPEATRIAVYIHYSSANQISDMVLYQLRLLDKTGFSIVFISMSEIISNADWEAARQICALVVQRRNFGLDFGAWRDVMPELRRRWSDPDELMLLNDSVLGPIRPLDPIIETMRRGGDGLFGLTESWQGGPHLQSYLLLARGQAAVSDVVEFLQNLHISHSKWLLILLGEIRLSRWMRRRGHRVAAVFGYDRLVRLAVTDPVERAQLLSRVRPRVHSEMLRNEDAVKILHRTPMNPTHHLWRVLVARFNDPFLKTELIVRNPMGLPDVTNWPTLVPLDSPCPLPVLQAHLQAIKAPGSTSVSAAAGALDIRRT